MQTPNRLLALVFAAIALVAGCSGDQRELDDYVVLRDPDVATGLPVVATTRLVCADRVLGEIGMGGWWGLEAWLDGEPLLAERRRNATSTELDQYRVSIDLAAGEHTLVVRFLNGDPPAVDEERVSSTDPGCVIRFADARGRALRGLALVAPHGVAGRDTWALGAGRHTGGTDGWSGVPQTDGSLTDIATLIADELRPLPIDPVPVVMHLDEVRAYPLHATVRRSATQATIELDWANAVELLGTDTVPGRYRLERTAGWHHRLPIEWQDLGAVEGTSTHDSISMSPGAWPWRAGDGMGRILTYRITPEPPRPLDWTAPRLVSALVIAPGFHDGEQVRAILEETAATRPELVSVEEIGRSSRGDHPILAARLSGSGASSASADEIDGIEGKPAVLVVGDVHAREPFGIEIGIDLVQRFSDAYGSDPQITGLLDDTELWVVPVLNSGAWHAIGSGFHGYFRKNLSDQNADGRVTPSPLYPIEWDREPLLLAAYDAAYLEGVDLNRNFAPFWERQIGQSSGSEVPGLHKYRGTGPFSEPETRAIRDLALRERFVFSLFYHEAGEKLYFLRETLDDDLYQQLVTDLGETPKRSRVGEWSGCSLSFMYWEIGTIDFTIEGATHARGDAEWLLAPRAADRDSVSRHHQGIVRRLMRLAAATGVHGLVIDGVTGSGIEATLEIRQAGIEAEPRRLGTDAAGRFHRYLLPGTYIVRASSTDERVSPPVPIEIDADRPARISLTIGAGTTPTLAAD